MDVVTVNLSFVMQEDDILRAQIAKYGAKNWTVIASKLPGRSGKSCRLR